MKKILTEWRQFINEQSAEERAKAFDAKMRKKYYGSEDSEEAPKDPKKAYADAEKRAYEVSGEGESPKMYFAAIMATLAGHLSGRTPTGYDRPENADSLLLRFSKSFNELGKGLDNNALVKFMEAAGLPTSLKFDANEDKIQKQVAASQPEHDKALRAALVNLFGEDYKNLESDLKHYAEQRRLDPEAYAKSRMRLDNMLKSKQNVQQMENNNEKMFDLMKQWNDLYMQQDEIIKQNIASGKIFDTGIGEVATEMNKIYQKMQDIETEQNKLAGTKI